MLPDIYGYYDIYTSSAGNVYFNMYNTQDLDYLLMELFASSSAAASYDFDSLLVPFRCVATDIDSSELIVLKNGDLAKAVRASITFPFFI